MEDVNLFDINAAIAQYDSDLSRFNECVGRNDGLMELAEAIMAIRSLDGGQRYQVNLVTCFCDGETSCLRRFATVTDPAEHLRLPSELLSLIASIEFNICDDGFLHLCRMDVLDDIESKWNEAHPENPGKIRNFRKDTIYFLTTSEFHDADANTGNPFDPTRKWLHDFGANYVRPVVTSFKSMYFGTIPRFTELMRIFVRPDVWDNQFRTLNASQHIDNLFFKE